MKGFVRFKTSMIKTAQGQILPLVEKYRDDIGEVLKNDIFKLEGPTAIERTLSARERFFNKLFHEFNEILSSIQTLEDIAFYISKSPFRNKQITPERYLQFHIESYYSEIYILRERLKRFFTLVSRQYKKDPKHTTIKEECDELCRLLDGALEGLLRTRGRHVHETRFKDQDINRLVILSMLLSAQSYSGEMKELVNNFYIEEYRQIKKYWITTCKKNNRNIRKLLDHMFEKLHPLIFDLDNNVLTYPFHIKAA